MSKWMSTLFLLLIFILLDSKGRKNKILIGSIVMGFVTGLGSFSTVTENGFLFTFVSSALLYYDSIVGCMMIIKNKKNKK